MANDVVGAPEIVLVKGVVFHFSPLNDLESSALSSWVAWRQKDEGWLKESDLLPTQAGAAQILSISTQRTERYTVEQAFDLLGNSDSAINEVLDGFLLVNELPSHFDTRSEQATNSKKGEDPETIRAKVYAHLADRYGWTFRQISEMTTVQQIIAIEVPEKAPVFDSPEEYQVWYEKNKHRFKKPK